MAKKSEELAVNKGQELKKNNEGYTAFNLDAGNELPNLDNSTAAPIDLMSDYWTPANEGEKKRLFFVKIDYRDVADQQSGEIIELECAYFLEQTKEGTRMISNGSKRLVGAIKSNKIKKGMPLLITYKGKRRNRTNQYHSDNWSIKPLVINMNNNK